VHSNQNSITTAEILLEMNEVWQNSEGFAQELFKQEVDDLYFCGICLLVINHPLQCVNGHVFCRSCLLTAIKRNNVCPKCRTGFPSDINEISFNLIVNNSIGKLDIMCPTKVQTIEDDGIKCEWIGKVYDLKTHMKTCGNVEVKCKCGEQIPRRKTCVTMCDYQNCSWTGCANCNTTRLPLHLLICENKTVLKNCEYCGQHLSVLQMTTHHLHCTYQPTHSQMNDDMSGPIYYRPPPCPYSLYGCGPDCTTRINPISSMQSHQMSISNMFHTLAGITRHFVANDLPNSPGLPFTAAELINIEVMTRAVFRLETVMLIIFGDVGRVCEGMCMVTGYSYHLLQPDISGMHNKCLYGKVIKYSDHKDITARSDVTKFSKLGVVLSRLLHLVPKRYFPAYSSTMCCASIDLDRVLKTEVKCALTDSEEQKLVEEMQQAIWTLSHCPRGFVVGRSTANRVFDDEFPKTNNMLDDETVQQIEADVRVRDENLSNKKKKADHDMAMLMDGMNKVEAISKDIVACQSATNKRKYEDREVIIID
jgi:hypothetical protein